MSSLILAASILATGFPAYDPLAVSGKVEVLDKAVIDTKRSRTLPLRIFLPDKAKSCPIVIFSHGLGGTCKGNAFLGEHLAKRGYVAVFVQHPGSDESVWRDIAPRERMQAMQRAADYKNFQLRVDDIHFLIDELGRLNQRDSRLKGHMDIAKIGMSGHSFGAVTTQATSGQTFAGARVSLTDARIRAAVMYSPSLPRAGADASQAFGKVKVPWLLMTGTEDTSPIGNQTVKNRLGVFPALPPGQKYQVVLFEAEHSAFTDVKLAGERLNRNPNHHRVMLGITTAFWDSTLLGDAAARAWLDGSGPRSILQPKDVWQKK